MVMDGVESFVFSGSCSLVIRRRLFNQLRKKRIYGEKYTS